MYLCMSMSVYVWLPTCLCVFPPHRLCVRTDTYTQAVSLEVHSYRQRDRQRHTDRLKERKRRLLGNCSDITPLDALRADMKVSTERRGEYKTDMRRERTRT